MIYCRFKVYSLRIINHFCALYDNLLRLNLYIKCLIIVSLVFVSCKERYKECDLTAPYVETYGYDSSEIDTIILSQFQKGSNLNVKIQDTIVTFERFNYTHRNNNNFSIYLGLWSDYLTKYELYDWRYTILKDGNTKTITNCVRKFNKTSYNHPSGCSSPIVEATIDGQQEADDFGIKFITLKK